MTTRYTYQYYNVYTLEHKGTFPFVHWETEKIILYDCPNVKVYLRIHPNGYPGEEMGHVCAFVYFEPSDPNITIEALFGCQINGAKYCLDENNEPTSTINFGKGVEGQFKDGRKGFCCNEMSEIFQEPKTVIRFAVKVLKYTSKKKGKEITTYPAGEQATVFLNEAARKEEQEKKVTPPTATTKEPSSKRVKT